jgi:nicotinate dehydrogenase medium molybdopterin subunit
MIKRGIGISCALQGSNTHFEHLDESHVLIEVCQDNTFLIKTAASDVGQGLEATLLTIASDAFGGLPVDRIRWSWPSTNAPNGGVTGASRQTTMTGNALFNACAELKRQISTVASEMMDLPPEAIEFSGEVLRDGTGKEIPLSDVLIQARKEGRQLTAHGEFHAPLTTKLDQYGHGNPISQFGYATYVAEVEVDTDTGEVKVLQVSAYTDAGRIINLIGAEAQIEGGTVMGLGYAITEDYINKNGKPVNVGFTNYLIPTVQDVPANGIKVHFVNDPVSMGELGVKGLAELPTTAFAPAITNAIFNATGARVTQLPATPERVYFAIQEIQQAR